MGEKTMSDKHKKLIRILPTGIMFMIVELVLALGACRVQMTDKLFAGSEGLNYMHTDFYKYNPATYTLGHILFIGLGTLIYFQIFAKEMRRILEMSLIFIIIEAVICILSAGGIYMLLLGQIVEKGKNIYIGGNEGNYVIGPDWMKYITMIGWSIYPLLLMMSDIVIWSAAGNKADEKKRGINGKTG